MNPPTAQLIEGTPGRCTNLDYCSIGLHRQVVTVPVGQAFACPECGKPLRPPGLRGLKRPIVLPALRIAILCIGIGLGAVLGYQTGRFTATQAPAAAKTPIVLPPASPLPAAPAPARHPVQLRPFPAHDIADPPQHLLREQHFGQITLDCLFHASRPIPSCHTTDIRGSDAFSASALDWLQSQSPLYPPGPDHRWRITIDDFAGQATNR
jgi:hypothetical protein